MKKKLTRLFSVLLAAVLVLGTLPVSAMGTDVADPPASAVDDTPAEVSAAEPEEASVVDETPDGEKTQSGEVEIAEVQTVAAPALEDKPYNIFFLDCGRKYYSVDSIETLINNASAAGFNYIQLAVGNDGLRFLLDDMSLTVNGTTYDSTKVSDAIHAGNVDYDKEKEYNTKTDELTEDDMDTIIAYANSKGMGVIPCVNTPGHMDAILYAATSLTGTNCAYHASVRTIAVTNDTAVAFTQALLQKYITYFAGKGCQLFNMGADEYANDKYDSGSMGFGNLQSTGKYSYYVQYVNQVAAMIKTAGMNPMAFNDGIYFGNNTSSGTFDKDIIVCYWSNGWPGYTPMPASDLAAKGFKLINTNGSYYWVLGKSNAQCDETKASGFDRTAFPGDATIKNPLGSMFCIWADYPGAETEESVITKTAATIAAFGKTLPKDEIVISDAANNGGQLETGGTMVLTANKAVDWTTSDASVASIAASDPEAVMAAAETETVNATAITVTAVAPGNATITAAAGGKTATYAVTVNDPGTKNVTVTVGGTTEVTVDGNYPGPFTTGNTGIATVQTKVNENDGNVSYKLATLAEGTFYVSASANDTEPSATLTFEDAGNGEYYIKDSDGNYIYPVARFSYNSSFNWSYAINQSKEAVAVTVNSNGTVSISKNYTNYWEDKDAYLTLSGNSFSATGNKTSLYLYEPVPGDKTYTTDITFKGVSVGTTSVQIGGVTYNINVVKEDLAKVTPLTIEYWVTNTRVTADNATSMDVSAAGVNSEEGTAISELVPLTGTTEQKHPAALWKGVRLLSNNKQTTAPGDDKTLAGDDFTYIRYWGGAWGFSADRTNWKQFNPTDQVVAYYMQRTTVTDEITTDVVDWGEDVGSVSWGPSGAYVELDFAVEYEDGQRTPDSFPVLYQDKSGKTRSKTMEFHCHTTDNYGNTIAAESRTIGRINAVETDQYEVYMITLTPNNDNKDTVLAQHPSTTSGFTYTYDGTEKVVWVDSEDNLGEFADTAKQAAGFRVGGEAAVDSLTIYKGQAMLVTYYVRAKVTADSLTVKYVNESTGNEFYSYSIAVASGKLFKDGIQLNNPWKQELINGDVVNYNGKTQNVTADLSKMPEISAAYRYSDYTCTRVEKSADGKTLTLYYTFNNVVSFIVDFGTPMEIKLTDLSADFQRNESKVSSITVTNKNSYGKTEVNQKNKTITYTPEAKYATAMNGDELAVTVSGYNPETRKEGTITYTVDILPASNVLYEENFLTTTDNLWSNADAKDHTNAQETQKANVSKSVFGYDNTYNASVGANGVWKAEGLSRENYTKEALTTTFYGNTFDLIGNCAPDTGRVLMVIKDANDKYAAIVNVDTRYTGTISQVPLAHVKLKNGNDAQYTVSIYASGLEADAVENTAVGTIAMDTVNAAAYEDEFLNYVLSENDLTLEDVDYISTSVAEELAESDSSGEAANNVKLASEDGNSTNVHHIAGTHVEIDGFRVYRSTTDEVAQKNYPESEQNVEYKNILDVVGSVVTAYTEGGTVTNCKVDAYEAKGGPQNEIYLEQNQSVVIQVSDKTPIQVSLRAVSGETSWSTSSNPESVKITSNTEMYYTITPDENNTVTITNQGKELLALGNVKAKNTETFISAENMDPEDVLESVRAAYGSSSEEPEVFTPETFTAKTTVTPVVRNKMVTLKVNVSSDVAYITVNGVKYTRTGLQGLFRKTRTIRVVNTVKKGQTKTYEVVAYNADGVASETITVTG